MSLPTVTQNINELFKRGLLQEAGMFDSTGGRKARAISCKYNARFALGLDITKNHIGVVAVDLSGTVIQHCRKRIPFKNNNEYFVGLGEQIEEFIDQSNIERSRILGVGIAVPAIVSQDTKLVIYSPILGFTGGKLQSFADFINYPTLLCNDANAAGTAELWIEGEEMNDVVYLSLNNSVGGAILMDGKLCFGKNMRGGEFGHMTIVPGGEYCYCGQRGCVDVYCNARILADSAGGRLELFFERLKTGSAKHRKIWEDYLNKLVLAVNNLRMAFDCNVILGGYVGSYLDNYIHELRDAVAQRNTFEVDGTYVKVCQYKLEATAVGAALMYVIPFIINV
jgi:predicted NBD/HSP70 family sugar kinase